MDNAFNRERAAVKAHAQATSGMFLLPCTPFEPPDFYSTLALSQARLSRIPIANHCNLRSLAPPGNLRGNTMSRARYDQCVEPLA